MAFDKPAERERIEISIGYGVLWVMYPDRGAGDHEFADVYNSGEPECQEVWDRLKGEPHERSE